MPVCSNCASQLLSPLIDLDLSAIRSKLRSDSGPSIAQPAEISTTFRNVQQDLISCEDEIQRLEIRRAYLVEQRSLLQDRRDHLQAFLSPVRRLPNEILQRIFDDCCDMNYFRVGGRRQKSIVQSKPALTLSSVSAQWRRNSLALSSIWSRITLSWMYEGEDYGGRETVHEKVLFILDTFLNRSRRHPLTVTLELKTTPVLQNGRFFTVVNRLVEQACRWRSFSSGGSYHGPARVFHRQIPSSLPLLEDVQFNGSYDSINVNILGTAPKVKSLAIDWHIPRSIESCVENLSHLELRPDYNNLETLFLNSPKLRSLKVYMNDEHYPHLAFPEDIYPKYVSPLSTTLEKLTLTPPSFIPEKANYTIFPFLNLPSLKTICLETNPYVGDPSWIDANHFVAFITRSSAKLTTLDIEGLAFSDSDLVLILTHMPTLLNFTFNDNRVSLESSPITRKFIQTLQVHGQQPLTSMDILPRLRYLKLILRAETFDDAVVIGMVRSRWKPLQSPQSPQSVRSSCPWRRRHALPEAGAKETEVKEPTMVTCLRECIIQFPNRMRSELEQVYASLDDIEKDGMRFVVLGDGKDDGGSGGSSGLASRV